MDCKDILVKVDGLVIRSEDGLNDKQMNCLLKHKLIKKKGSMEYRLSFVGCVEIEGKILISLPYGINENSLNTLGFHGIRSFIIKLIKSIRIFEQYFLGKNEIITSGKIAASFSLLEDFEENGYITKFIKQNIVNGSGSINWKRTIKQFQPIKVGSSWVYKDLINRSNTHHENHELILIQNWALQQALKYSSLLSDEHSYLEDEFESPLTKTEVREILQRLYTKVTKDRELYVLDLILQLFEDQDTTQFSAIYTKNFNLIWEVILQKGLEHNESFKQEAPSASWNDDFNINQRLKIKNKYQGAPPEVDIVFKHHETLYLLDAKYYDIVNNGNRPGLTDLYKQFYYGQVFKAVFDLEYIPKNGFLFPCYMPNEEEYAIKFSDVEYKVELDGEMNILTKIPAYAVSIEKTIDAFLNHKSVQNEFIDTVQ